MTTMNIEKKYDWNSMSLYEFLKEGNIPSYWKEFFEEETDNLKSISNKIQESQAENKLVVYPEINRVFRAFYITPLENIRVAVIGMEPYADGNAVGLCFSIPTNSTYVNPSLKNIYNELEDEGYSPKRDGNLVPWAKQGVFLINAFLTVEKGNSGSHSHVWYNFTKKLLNYISEKRKNIVWVLLGNDALEFREYIKSDGKNILCSTHPSPFSAYRDSKKAKAFLGSGIFKNVNEKLKDMGKTEIVW